MIVPKPAVHALWKPETAIRHLPKAYQDFYREWQHERPQPVHYQARGGRWYQDETTGEIKRVRNVPLELTYPEEMHQGLWGGEAVVKGYRVADKFGRLMPRWWKPGLQRVNMYSEVLDSLMEVTVTRRAVYLVHKHYGLDFYLLQNRACDIMSLLGLKIKREILLALSRKSLWSHDLAKQQEMLDKYSQYTVPEEEAIWYGLTVDEALDQYDKLHAHENKPKRFKEVYRQQLLDQLKQEEKEQGEQKEQESERKGGIASWINPFSKGK